MNSIIELRKKELAAQINKLIGEIRYFIVNKKKNKDATSISQYLENNESILYRIEDKLQIIEFKFDPQSDIYETFEYCIDQLKELQNNINEIQKRGEIKLKNLEYLLPIKILISIIFSGVYIWIWIIYWRWLDGWWYITLIGTIWYLPTGPFLLVFYYLEDSDKIYPTFGMFRPYFTKLLLKD